MIPDLDILYTCHDSKTQKHFNKFDEKFMIFYCSLAIDGLYHFPLYDNNILYDEQIDSNDLCYLKPVDLAWYIPVLDACKNAVRNGNSYQQSMTTLLKTGPIAAVVYKKYGDFETDAFNRLSQIVNFSYKDDPVFCGVRFVICKLRK